MAYAILFSIATFLLTGFRTKFEDSISTGDVLTVLLGIVGAYGTYKVWQWRHRHPVIVSLLKGTYSEELPSYSRNLPLSIPLGDNQPILIQGTFRIGREVSAINVRFVQRTCSFRWKRKPKLQFYKDASEESVKVIGYSVEYFPLSSTPSRRINTGHDYKFSPITTFSEGNSIWINAVVNAKRNWSGYISLEVSGGIEPRGFGRGKIVTGEPASWL